MDPTKYMLLYMKIYPVHRVILCDAASFGWGPTYMIHVLMPIHTTVVQCPFQALI